MGLCVYPVFDRAVEYPEPESSGEFLGEEFAAVDEIARRIGVPGVTHFADNRRIPEGFAGPPDELEELLRPPTAWYSAGDGEAAFRELARVIRSDPAARRLEDPTEVARELDDLAGILHHVQRTGARFRLDLA